MARYLIMTGLKVVGTIAGVIFLFTPRGSDHLALFITSLGVAAACFTLSYLLDDDHTGPWADPPDE